MSEPTAEEWAEIARRLQEPFDPRDVEFRPQGKLTGEGKGRAIAYVDARVVAARLDAVVGAQHWEFYWEPVILDTAVRVVKGTIVIHGVSKSDIGDGERTEPNKAAVSDALKRTAVLWGPGRYLYHLEAEWVQGKPGQGDNWYISDAELNRLRGKLPKSGVQPAPEPPGRPQSAQANTRLASDSQRGTAPATVAAEALISPDDQAQIRAAVSALGWSAVDCRAYLKQYGVERFSELTAEQAREVVPDLLAKSADVQGAA